MSFWGASNTQKEATGFPRELGTWSFEQLKSWLGRANAQGATAEQLQQFAQDYWKERTEKGLATPEEIRRFGQEIMPGIDAAIAARGGRLDQVGQDWNNTEAGVRGRLDQQGENINSTFDQGRDTIDQTYGRIGTRGGNLNREITQNIGDTYGSAQAHATDAYRGLRDESAGTFDRIGANTAGVYGGLRDATGSTYGGLTADNAGTFGGLTADTAGTYGGLRGENDAAYSSASQTIDRLNPTGDFRAATAARAFAPAMAATQRRLRAAGIDPNSPEAAAQLNMVEGAKGRAMDDAFADATTQYVDRKTGLTLGQAGVNRDLALGRLNTTNELGLGRLDRASALTREGASIDRNLAQGAEEIGRGTARERLLNNQGLVQQQNAIDRDLALQSGADFRGEMVRNQGHSDAVDAGYLQNTQANNMARFGATQGYFDRGNQFDTSAFGTRAGLAGQLNDEELQRLNLQQGQWGTGMQYAGAQQDARNQAAGTLTNMGQQAYGNAANASGQAGNWGQGAQSAYGQSYGYEAPNAGWGTKMLTGAAGTALNMFAPGAGTALMGVASGGAGGAGGYGAYGTPPFVPQQRRLFGWGGNSQGYGGRPLGFGDYS